MKELKDQHMTPMNPSKAMEESRAKVLEHFFGKALEICGYCGFWKHKQTHCLTCNHVIEYLDEFDKLGNPIEVWVEKK